MSLVFQACDGQQPKPPLSLQGVSIGGWDWDWDKDDIGPRQRKATVLDERGKNKQRNEESRLLAPLTEQRN